MDQSSQSEKASAPGQYDSMYGNFQSDLYAQIRREAFGEDIGQNSWHTAAEQDRFLKWLNLSPGKKILDVACGAGGPVLRIAALTGSSVAGIDVHPQAISTARALATERGLSARAEFQVADATKQLPFPAAALDAVICIDAINHLSDRPRVIAEWARILKPGGRILFTNATTVTGPLTNSEIAIRSSASFYLFVPQGYDEQVIAESGLKLIAAENATRSTAEIAERRRSARAARSAELRKIEGDQSFEQLQTFLEICARVAGEARLSRFVFVAEK